MFHRVIQEIKVAQFFETRCIKGPHWKLMQICHVFSYGKYFVKPYRCEEKWERRRFRSMNRRPTTCVRDLDTWTDHKIVECRLELWNWSCRSEAKNVNNFDTHPHWESNVPSPNLLR